MVTFISNSAANVQFYFNTKYSIDEITQEINKYIIDNFWYTNNIRLNSNWTIVPVIKNKIKIIYDPGLLGR